MHARIPLKRHELQVNVDLAGPISRMTIVDPGTGKGRTVYRLRDFLGYMRLDWWGDGRCVDRQLKVWPLRFTLMVKGYGLERACHAALKKEVG